jgi:hypothetical protein
MLSRKIILLSLIAASTTLHAATEFPNGQVPAEIAAEFAGGGTLHQGLPDNFPPLTVPASLKLRVLGTNQRNQYTQTILLHSTLGVQALHEGLVAALEPQGWQELARSFIAVDPFGYLQLCHDVHGSMTLNMSRSGNATRLQVQRTVLPASVEQPACADQQADYAESAARYAFYEGLVPLLEVPDGTLRPAPIGIRGISASASGSSVRIQREGTIEVPGTTTAQIDAHFTAQLREQGWVKDSGGTGSVSAVSTWTRTVTPPGATSSEFAAVTLNVLELSEDSYAVSLVLRSPQASGSGALIVSPTRL